ncbi:MAG: 2,5-diamino-6-(ribosylamino)-4(3H)-pyrimidinone 5'-phosphate reductase [Promethearchaeota archaeon]|nr:MAG: 2,5-diamino-6-(ribosylamino)-4(3H)-pyrimidinone 5'-phosphate reductase [Candidatus Lokiarchaeota archaeon]
MKDFKKPYIILSAAMTIDGKIASKTGDPELSDEKDWKEVHKLRTEVDAIMVGRGTIENDDPKLHIKYYKHEGYYRIVLDSHLSIPISSKVIQYKPDIYPTILCTTENISKKKVEDYQKQGVEIIKAGKGNRVNVLKLMPKLYERGIESILLEGGGTLNWSFVKAELIDEIRLTVAPWIIGGIKAHSLVDGNGFERMNQALLFRLVEIAHRDNYVILKYMRR